MTTHSCGEELSVCPRHHHTHTQSEPRVQDDVLKWLPECSCNVFPLINGGDTEAYLFLTPVPFLLNALTQVSWSESCNSLADFNTSVETVFLVPQARGRSPVMCSASEVRTRIKQADTVTATRFNVLRASWCIMTLLATLLWWFVSDRT